MQRAGFAIAIACLVLFALNTFGGIEFTSWRAQAVAQTLAWVVALAALLWLSFRIPHRGLRTMAAALSSIVCVVCFVGVAATVMIDGLPRGVSAESGSMVVVSGELRVLGVWARGCVRCRAQRVALAFHASYKQVGRNFPGSYATP